MAKSGVKPLIFLIAVSVMAWLAEWQFTASSRSHLALTWSSTTLPTRGAREHASVFERLLGHPHAQKSLVRFPRRLGSQEL